MPPPHADCEAGSHHAGSGRTAWAAPLLVRGGIGSPPAAWERQARRVAEVCAARLPVLIGVYVHGSAALGGFTRTSDLDVLVIGEHAADWQALGRELLSTANEFRWNCPW